MVLWDLNKEDKWRINGIENDEQIIESYHRSELATNGLLKIVKHHPYKTPKNWRKDTVWKNVKEHFYALTNKRWLFVDYDSKSIIESYNLAECDVLAGTGSITFMRGNNMSLSIDLDDNLRIVQMIKHIQSTLPGRMTTQTPTSQSPPAQQSSEDPLKVFKIRFVKGEITKEEFEEMKSMLE